MVDSPPAMSRRSFLGMTGLIGAAAFGAAGCVVERAHRFDPAGVGSLADVEHIVLLMQENRSFDHYFGTMSGVRGFDDKAGVFSQRGYRPGFGADASGELMPFHLDTRDRPVLDADVINDPTHSWVTQHEVWRHGAMDNWVKVHVREDGPANGPMSMGYYTRADIPTHYLLADAFTVCDQYFSSVLGPTAPNRLHWMTGSLDPHGFAGGPILDNAASLPIGSLSWRTYAENLDEAGVSWKVYNHAPADAKLEVTGMLKYFRAYADPESALFARGLVPRYPRDFAADVAAGTLPAVSWLIPSMVTSEHPAHPPAVGAEGIVRVLDVLTANPAVWEKTALIVSFDENGGFFDHVAPPTPPAGTAGEFVAAVGPHRRQVHTTGPIGLGFRVPCLVLSPYTRGGLLSSAVMDHTSQLRLLEARFGVAVPNLSAWRRATVGDMTSLFVGARTPSLEVPGFPGVIAAAEEALSGDATDIAQASRGHGTPYPVPPNSQPRQERAPIRTRLPG